MKVVGSLSMDGTFWCVPEFSDKKALREISERLRYIWQLNCAFSKYHSCFIHE